MKLVSTVHNNDETVKQILNSGKGNILKEFEKICPTDMSFQRMKKDMHDIFDEMERQLNTK